MNILFKNDAIPVLKTELNCVQNLHFFERWQKTALFFSELAFVSAKPRCAFVRWHFFGMKHNVSVMGKLKTDKSDAKVICEYAIANDVPLYNALTNVQAECLQLFDSYLKKRTATKTKCMVRKPWESSQSLSTVL